MKTGKWLVVLVGVLVAILSFAAESRAQSQEGFIYGKIYTNSTTYTGAIRWGGEEALWTDMFNAAKVDDSYRRLIPEKDRESESSNFNWDFASIWTNSSATQHQFTCQFGNIKEIITGMRDNVILKLKNGGELKVNGQGYNDIGAKLRVTDEELGGLSIDWDRITRIEFLPTPSRLNTSFGPPLFGTVEGVRNEKFTGYVIWDNDERLLSDKLDGDTEDGGDVSIKFSDIESIERDGNGCQVKLKSGRKMYLRGSNDVNNENRGVYIASRELGMIKVAWRAFRKITFTSPTEEPQKFDEFTSPKFLNGTVSRFEGDDVRGRIVYDIDETLDFELIEGEENNIEYHIPMKAIKRITPRNEDFTQVQLTSGRSLLLGDMRDVSSQNGGVLIFVKGKKEPAYVRWRQVNEIIFD